MALPLMVRVDDDIAEALRERSYKDRTPMNRIINDALRKYLEAGPAAGTEQITEQGRNITKTFGVRLEQLTAAVRDLQHQENAADYRAKTKTAFDHVLDCVKAIMFSLEPDLTPKVLDEQRAREKVKA